ncbi:hypothetical protein BDY21DRAFT_354102 [Lineolata rhizophorae]|uniref:Uncharacterized protein n=1 Tax=Lineolata rhizophorae TaxID=578093 RepID=A0A6A6NRP3_9PEZI|nr:hypothetical protein BDY21DRAFT_354102 [Lineolata rhizophorae]
MRGASSISTPPSGRAINSIDSTRLKIPFNSRGLYPPSTSYSRCQRNPHAMEELEPVAPAQLIAYRCVSEPCHAHLSVIALISNVYQQLQHWSSGDSVVAVITAFPYKKDQFSLLPLIRTSPSLKKQGFEEDLSSSRANSLLEIAYRTYTICIALP